MSNDEDQADAPETDENAAPEAEPGDDGGSARDAELRPEPPDAEPARATGKRSARKKKKTRADAPPAPQTDDAPEIDAPADRGATEEAAAEAALIPPGNPLRIGRGSAIFLFGTALAFFLMAFRHQMRFGVPAGAIAIAIATFGVLDLIGSFDDPDDRVAHRTTAGALAGPLALLFGGLGAMGLFITLAVDGRLTWFGSPVLTSGVLVPAAFLTAVVGFYNTGDRLGVWDKLPDGKTRPIYQRHGFWLIVVATLLYLPFLGSHSLSDPWETHYGEVSREILSRNDWISLWWAQDGWFWSKPVLDMWLQAMAMATFGVRYLPDQMLSAVREGRIPWPEWAVRLPIFLLALIAVYLLYKAVARVFGRRAGLLGGVVLLTMPQWFLITHQTVTDMPFVAPMAAAMALFLLGAHEDPEEEVRVYEIDLVLTKIRLSGFHLIMGAIIACALPQILYLFSRNLEISTTGFHPHLDAFSAGSPGNCGLPGNEACRPAQAVLRGLHPALQALIWAQALALIVYMSWGERRRQRLFFLGAWLFAALSTMAKGPAGVGLPVICALAYVLVSRRYRDLIRMEIASGALIVLAVALPWYVAMYARHGQPFTDRLLFHDMFKRAFTHVHDTNEGDDVSFRFYIWQLGYATFPWTGLVPAGLVYWLRRREEGDRQSDASVFMAMWFVFAFALFSLMLTKFHHYILPAVPPAAMLTGVLLDALLRRTGEEESKPAAPRPIADTAIYAAGIGAGTTIATYGISRLIEASRAGFATKPRTALLAYVSSTMFARGLIVVGVALFGLTVFYWRKRAGAVRAGAMAQAGAGAPEEGVDLGELRAPGLPTEGTSPGGFGERFERIQLGAAAVAGAILVFMVGRDMSANFDGLNNQIRLLHLFTYNYRRPWPTSLNFTAALWAFTAAAAVLTAMLVWARARRHIVAGLLALAAAFTIWGLDVYFMQTSPHWGQRETMIAYYQASREIPGPFIAYQMNWKGENFYTGNHVPAFVSSGKKFTDYMAEEKRKGGKVFYFATEHGRTGTLQNELGATKTFEKLTPPELNNKFVIVRATFD